MRRRVSGGLVALGASLALTLAFAPPQQDWRAAALASFDAAWQTINDTFYDPAFGGVDWAAVSKELRPRVTAASSPDEARTVIREMLARLKKSHFVLLSPSGTDVLPGPASIPADVRMAGNEALVTRVTDPAAAAAGLKAGQTLLKIDDRELAPLVAKAQGADARMRNLDAWRRINQVMHGSDGSIAVLQVRAADGAMSDLRITRTRGSGEEVTLGNLPPLRVAFESRAVTTPGGKRAGVIGFSVWMTAISEKFANAIDTYRKADGLVIDLRGNPGGVAGMMTGISGHLIAEPLVLGTMRTREATLTFKVNPRLATADGRSVKPFAGPVALLVDELTGSTSETFAGALQSLGRVRIFGRPTMGQALPAVTLQLANGDVLMHAIGDFTTSTGKSLEGDGVTPDVTIPLSAKALSAGRDEVFEAALAWFDLPRK